MRSYNILEKNDEKSLFYYESNFLDNNRYKELYKWLQNKNYKEGHCISGKEIPRLQLWYHEKKKYFCNTWKVHYSRWESEEYDDFLKSLQNEINIKVSCILDEFNMENLQKPNLNSCLVNLYRDGNDSIKPHQDTSLSFGNYPTIIGLSIGESRNIIISETNKTMKKYNSSNNITNFNKKNKLELKIPLENNSLFIMAGASQKYYTHQIPKNDSKKNRYSLTFREHLDL